MRNKALTQTLEERLSDVEVEALGDTLRSTVMEASKAWQMTLNSKANALIGTIVKMSSRRKSQDSW